MARYGLWVAALSLVCLIAVVTSENVTQMNTDENICARFFNDGSTMTVSRVFDMIAFEFSDYVPDMAIELLLDFMNYADSDRDNRLNQTECENLIKYIKDRTPDQLRK